MVTYCIGSARQKREYFKTTAAVVLDNAEVLFCASENGRNYFAYGDVPFAAFSVREYLHYRRALCGGCGSDVIKTLEEFRIRPDTKLRRLAPAQMRCVAFLEKTGGASEAPVVVNLDGAKYTRKNAAALSLLLSKLRDAYVCVTDKRFLKHAAPDIRVLRFGRSAGRRPSFYRAHALARRIGAKRVAVM